MATTIGIRELRQNASRYLRRVRAGETITITDRGEPVAELRPVRQHGNVLERLVAEGRVTPPKTDLREFLKNYPPIPREPGERLLSDILREMRDEEQF